MNTINGNFIEKSIPNSKNATLSVNIGGVDSTMTVEKFAAEIASVAPYKVFTALLTQIGGDDPISIDTGLLNIGATYYINNDSPGMDFTNVGASNNNTGTYFVATGTTPNSWGSNEGIGNATLIYNTGAPVVTILENTLGNIWFEYVNVGNYLCYFLPIADFNKTFCLATNNDSAQNYSIGFLEFGSYVNGQINIVNWDLTGNLFDGMYQAIEIRVYN